MPKQSFFFSPFLWTLGNSKREFLWFKDSESYNNNIMEMNKLYT